MDQIEDKEVARLWAIHFPKHKEDVKSKTLCLAMFMMVTENESPLLEISKLMGHSSPAITLAVYARWANRQESKSQDNFAARIMSAGNE